MDLEGSLLGFWLGLVAVLEIGKNDVNELGLWDGKVLSTTLGAMD